MDPLIVLFVLVGVSFSDCRFTVTETDWKTRLGAKSTRGEVPWRPPETV